MPTPAMTEAEIISYLGKTSLPTILVEGTDDASIYRWLESQLGLFSGNFLVCSGRETLISIYRRRETFTHGKLAWIADLDMWRYTSPPSDLSGIIFTTGYSIENDVYANSDIEALLESVERTQHTRLLEIACRWFTFELLEFQAGRPHCVAIHINQFVDFALMDISNEFRVARNYVEPSASRVQSILDDYKLSLRGKTLLQIIIKYLSDSKRTPKYSYAAIIEICIKLYRKNCYIDRILSEAKAHLA